MAENALPKKNVAYTFYVALVNTASRPDLLINPTLAAGDVQRSIGGAAFVDLTTLPVVTPAGQHAVKVDLSAAEMNADNVTVRFIDVAGAEWDDLFIELRPSTRKLEDLAFPTASGNSLDVAATGEVGLDFGNAVGSITGGELGVGAFAASAITAAAIATDAFGLAKFADDWQQRLAAISQGSENQTIYVASTGSDANTAPFAWDNAKLTLGGAITAASAGDTIILGDGEFNESTQMVFPARIKIFGQGAGRTRVKNTLSSNTQVQNRLSDYCEVAYIRFTGKDYADVLAGDDHMIMGADTGDGVFVGAWIHDCTLEGTFDGIICDGFACSLTLERVKIISDLDAIFADDGTNIVIRDCEIICDGTLSAVHNSGSVRGIFTGPNGPSYVKVFNTSIRVTGGGSANQCLRARDQFSGTSAIEMIGGSLHSSGTGADDVNIGVDGAVISLSGVAYDKDKITIDGGTFRVAQAGADWEQLTPTSPTADTRGEAARLAHQKLVDAGFTAATFAAGAIDAAALATDAVTEIRDAVTGGAYALDTDLNGRVRIVDGTAAGELDTLSGKVLVQGTINDLDSLNDLSSATVSSLVGAQLVLMNLDHLFKVAILDTDVIDNSFAAKITDSTVGTADYTNFDNTTDSLRAIRDNTAWDTATGFSTLTTAEVNTEVDNALNTAIPGSPTADSINERIVTMDAGVILAAAEDVYHADIRLTVDDANSQDEYTVTWFKNGVRITSGITVPTIQVVKRTDGTDLVASAAMTEIGSTGSYKYDEAVNRTTAGEAATVDVAATIDAGGRGFTAAVTRDSSA